MRYYKSIIASYIAGIGTGAGNGTEITESEYNAILDIIHNKPAASETTDYRLKTDLTWEPYEIEPPDPDPELDDSDALDILLGGD